MIALLLKLAGGLPGLARTWWRGGLGLAVGVALALPLGQCQGVHRERERQAAAVADAALLQAHKNAAAAEAAAVQRALDVAAAASRERTRNDAIKAAPAGRAPASSVALACERLRQQGTRPDRLPAACRPDRPGQAAAHP